MVRFGSFRMGLTVNQRRASLVGFGLALSVCGAVLVRFPPDQFGFYWVCPLHAWTGLLCPGCGGTRAAAALLRGHLAEAWRLNGLVVGLVPFAAGYGLLLVRRVWFGGVFFVPVATPVWGVVAVVAAVFTVMRNLG